ncbi:uncharacterized protein J3D65DRAFT_612675 [Phyllosticta citribraziliensis]|uniref:Uncharacterized protein n=1 Tax=Phyllosticta citribraziliensis TaxID=989973 RepID=A0ABR1M3F4_9PEZI
MPKQESQTKAESDGQRRGKVQQRAQRDPVPQVVGQTRMPAGSEAQGCCFAADTLDVERKWQTRVVLSWRIKAAALARILLRGLVWHLCDQTSWTTLKVSQAHELGAPSTPQMNDAGPPEVESSLHGLWVYCQFIVFPPVRPIFLQRTSRAPIPALWKTRDISVDVDETLLAVAMRVQCRCRDGGGRDGTRSGGSGAIPRRERAWLSPTTAQDRRHATAKMVARRAHI